MLLILKFLSSAGEPWPVSVEAKLFNRCQVFL